jgi:hypothetical protein
MNRALLCYAAAAAALFSLEAKFEWRWWTGLSLTLERRQQRLTHRWPATGWTTPFGQIFIHAGGKSHVSYFTIFFPFSFLLLPVN